MRNLAWARLESGSQVSSDGGYPSHWTWNCWWEVEPLWAMMDSMMYSSSPWMSEGGGDRKFGLCLEVS